MKESLLELIKNSQRDLDWRSILLNIIVATLLGVIIFVSYMASHRGTIYSRRFNVSLVIFTILTATVMTVIGNNITLSLGMVGALSIVRFRTAVKDPQDTLYLFWAIIVGICCGVGDFVVAGIGSAVVFFILIIFGAVRRDNRMLVIVRGRREKEGDIRAVIYQRFRGKATTRAHNTTKENVEFIFEVSNKMLEKAEKNKTPITDDIYSLGGVDYVNIVMQNDDIST